jgi:hypothetical protein
MRREGCEERRTCFAEDELITALFVEGRATFVEMNMNDTVHNFALARVNSRHVNGDRPGLEPELTLPPNERGDLGGMNDILARQASGVDVRGTGRCRAA